MKPARGSLLQGTLNLLILETLSRGSLHGYGIARWIEERTEDALRVEEGSLYPALYRMERMRWISARWGTSEIGKRIKVYSLTKLGREQLGKETADWEHVAAAIARVLRPEPRR